MGSGETIDRGEGEEMCLSHRSAVGMKADGEDDDMLFCCWFDVNDKSRPGRLFDYEDAIRIYRERGKL
jgi:hypothetical protein